jgi:hypothetical protein
MRFRFGAANVSGESRAGFLDADSSEHAHRLLERRGLRASELIEVEPDPELGFVPLEDPPPASSAPRAPSRSAWKEALAQLNWPKLVGFCLLFALVVAGTAYLILGRINSRVYSMHISGSFHLKSKRALDDSYWQRFVLEVLLPEAGLRIDQRGHIFASTREGSWVAGPKPSGQPNFSVDAEGNYQFDFALPLGRAPKQAKVVLLAPGFEPAERKLTFQANHEGVLEGTADSVILRRPKKAGQANSTNSKTKSVEPTQVIPKVDGEAGEIAD